jgi:aryl-alcohol dehydrogenase-like predicted oxidoreductase
MRRVEGNCSRRAFLGLLAGLSLQALGGRPARAGTGCALLRRTIPKTQETLPAVGLGTWQGLGAANFEESCAVLARFVELGGELLDTAPMYGDAQRAVGDIVRVLDVRDRLFLATKVLSTGREAGRSQMRESFDLLGITRLDLMQIHNLVDWRTQLRSLGELRAAGTVRYAGVTHYRVDAHAQLEQIVKNEAVDFVQVNYNIAVRDAEKRLLPLAAERGVAVIVNRPFEEGALFGRIRGGPLPAWAGEIDCTSFGQIFLKFILAHPAVTCAIPGTHKLRHLEDNLGAACGRLPDAATRRRMVEWFDGLPG